MKLSDAREILANPKNVRFAELLKVCATFFGEPRIRGSHHKFKTPWMGEPYVNIQRDGKMAKDYQVKQVLKALDVLEEMMQ